MSKSLVDPVAMAAAAQEATEAVTDMGTRLTTVTNEVDAAKPGFQGPAGDAFETAWGYGPQDGLQGKMRAILREFETMASIVGVGGKRHGTTEDDSSGRINQVAASAPGPVFSTLNPGA